MSVDSIFGSWDELPSDGGDDLSRLWHKLAAQHVGTPQQVNNSGLSQRRHEITMLWELFRRAKPNIILEIGTSQGGTLAAWCQLAPSDALIISIDRCVDDCRPRPGDPIHPDITARCEKFTTQGGGAHYLKTRSQRLVAINGWSYEAHVMETLLETLDGRLVDFLFDDASHSAEMFAKDWKAYWPLVADGGIFASHDVNWSADPACNKRTEWERIKREKAYSACYEFLPHSSVSEMGIGVIVK